MNAAFHIFAALDPASIVKEAYDKDFRWWFLALLVLVLTGGLWALKYLVYQSEKDRVAHAGQNAAMIQELTSSREHHHARVEAMQAEAFTVAREVASIVSANTKVVESNTRESEKIRAVMERLERKT